MKGFKLTLAEKDQLTGQKMESGGYINPVPDQNGVWFIFEIEHNFCGLGVEAEFIPPPNDETII